MALRTERSRRRHAWRAEQGSTSDVKSTEAEDVRRAQLTPASKSSKAVPRTRISSAWTAVAVGLLFLIALLIFIFQNLQNVRVSFTTVHGSFPLALLLLCSAVAGALIVLLLGVGRMIQLRRVARHHRDAADASRSASS